MITGAYLLSALQPPAAGALLEDLALVLRILPAFPRRLSLLVDAPATRHNTDIQHQNVEQNHHTVDEYLTDVFYKKTLGIFSKYTFSRNHNIQGWIERRHCSFFPNHYSLHDTRYEPFARRIIQLIYLSRSNDNTQRLHWAYSW